MVMQILVEKSITSLKLLTETTLYRCTNYALMNNSTAAIRNRTDQRSISIKLQTSLYMMTVTNKAARGWYAGFQLKNQ